jgi:hypothetical protein
MTSLICPSSGSCPIYNLHKLLKKQGTSLAYSSSSLVQADIIARDAEKGYLCLALENVKIARARLADPSGKEAFQDERQYFQDIKHTIREDSSCALIKLLNLNLP